MSASTFSAREAVIAPSLTVAATPQKPAQRLKFPFLDGLRGLAALYVVIHHEAQVYRGENCTPPSVHYALYPYMILGNYAVVMAIVMSGFCLMLSVIRSKEGKVRGGVGAYLWRRIRRLVPGYYAAIAISLILVALVPAMRRHDGELWGFSFAEGPSSWKTIYDWKSLVAHLLMLHSLSPNWIMRIDPPMWSVGIEWINILLMPLILIPVWKRGGGVLLAIFATFFCFLPIATKPFFHGRLTMQWAQPWLIAQFAFGMAAAALLFPTHTPDRLRPLDRFATRIAIHPLTLIAALLGWTVLLLISIYRPASAQRVPLTFCCGTITFCLILHGVLGTPLGRLIIKPLESRFALWLGTISYSLYLLHTPIQMLFQRAMEPLHLPPFVRLWALLLLATPLCLLVGAVGYRFFERPFIRHSNTAEN